jgi:hypothetical protein
MRNRAPETDHMWRAVRPSLLDVIRLNRADLVREIGDLPAIPAVHKRVNPPGSGDSLVRF